MANPYYSYSASFMPFTSARAEALAAEFQAIQAGFALLASSGVDSGGANAYIVTTGGAPIAAYTDGNRVMVKLLNANTGASTVNVNGLGVVSIYRYDGTALQANDILANAWYSMIYNSSYGGYQLLAPGPGGAT